MGILRFEIAHSQIALGDSNPNKQDGCFWILLLLVGLGYLGVLQEMMGWVDFRKYTGSGVTLGAVGWIKVAEGHSTALSRMVIWSHCIAGGVSLHAEATPVGTSHSLIRYPGRWTWTALFLHCPVISLNSNNDSVNMLMQIEDLCCIYLWHKSLNLCIRELSPWASFSVFGN